MPVTKSNIEDVFNNLKNIGVVAPGLDKIGYDTVKAKGLLPGYVDYIYDALNGDKIYYFTKYREVLKIKGKDKKPRIVSVPCMRDRLMLKTLQKYYYGDLLKKMPFNNIVKSVYADIQSKKYNYALKLDITAFFDNISLSDIEAELISLGFEKHIIDITLKSLKTRTVSISENKKELTRTDESKIKGIPQGIIISNAIAELIGTKIDSEIKKELSTYKVSFYRFVDDMVFVYNSRSVGSKAIIKIVKSVISKYSLSLNNRKTKIIKLTNDFDFLGYVFKNKNKITISDDMFKKKASKLERVIFDFANFKYGSKKNYDYLLFKLNNEIAGFKANNKYYSWPHYFKLVNDLSIYYRLDRVVKKLYKRAGLDPAYLVKVKSFVVARKEVFDDKSTYIPDLKKIYATTAMKKTFLVDLFDIPSSSSDAFVENMFNHLVQKSIFEMEKDLDFKFSK